MQWQEYVFFVGQMVFNIALLPSIFSKNKPALSTSLMTAGMIFIYVFTYFSMSLWLTGISMGTTFICWTILAYQKYRMDKK